ncbi:MAG: carboxylesterase family protein [Dehalococcoidia bacterium]|nr:carboxylesterase family protein [Dehalococcoidia bacterium]
MAVVQTTHGKVQGLERGGHEAYFGIPYAAPVDGAARFRAPRPAEAWSGVREATERGLAAPQGTHPVQGFAASGPRGEDCLNLNVFTPASDGRHRPVMFWIHGGGYTHGAGYEDLYNGGPLAERGDVVVVTINYRLGALGYLHLGESGSDDDAENRGSLDQVAALQWVRDNIEAFGGDPSDVTIFGESAGAGAVAVLLAMPAARGLFRRAIMQSGGARALSPEAATKATDTLLAELGLDRPRFQELAEIPHQRIVEAQERALATLRPQGIGFSPVRDPKTLPDSPRDALRDGAAAGIPLLIGTNRDEVKLFLPPRREPIADADLPAAVRPSLGRAPPRTTQAQSWTPTAPRAALEGSRRTTSTCWTP